MLSIYARASLVVCAGCCHGNNGCTSLQKGDTRSVYYLCFSGMRGNISLFSCLCSHFRTGSPTVRTAPDRQVRVLKTGAGERGIAAPVFRGSRCELVRRKGRFCRLTNDMREIGVPDVQSSVSSEWGIPCVRARDSPTGAFCIFVFEFPCRSPPAQRQALVATVDERAGRGRTQERVRKRVVGRAERGVAASGKTV